MQERLDHIVKDLKDAFKIPAISVSVYKDGKTFFCNHGYADLEKGVEATEDTVYAIASSSKAFIATALCILQDDGKLSLDDKIKMHLPEFKMFSDALTNELTIRDALCHRTGLPRHDLMWMNLRDVTIHEIIRRLQYLQPSFPPRTRMHYQNHMFALGSVLVEKISGKPWQDFVQERIFEPMGMTSSYTKTIDWVGNDLPNGSEPYALKKDVITKIPYMNIDHVGGAGCISSSVRDLDKWARLHLNKGEFEGKRVFSEKMAKQLHYPQMIIKPGEMFPPEYEFPETEFISYGLGWFTESYRGHKLVHHGGTINGYKSLVGFLPNEDVAFSILTNLSGNQAPTALGYIICDLALNLSEIDWGNRLFNAMNTLLGGMKKQKNEIDEKLSDVVPPVHALSDYCHAFEHPAYGIVTVSQEGDSLYMDLISEKCKLNHMGYDNFFVSIFENNMYLPVTFQTDFDGTVHKVLIQLEGLVDWIEFKKVD